MTRKASGDSGERVSHLIFPEIQDSFTFDSRRKALVHLTPELARTSAIPATKRPA
jgi:hypothetical protein